MSPERRGLAKLSEECGELQQIIGKRLIKTNKYKDKLEEEISDVLAAAEYVIQKLKLNRNKIEERASLKLNKRFIDVITIDLETGEIYD